MLAEAKTKTNVGVGLGFVFHFLGAQFESKPLVSVVLLLLGTVFLIAGCGAYAQGKGYGRAWGLLGLLSFVGFIILFLFPDKHKS